MVEIMVGYGLCCEGCTDLVISLSVQKVDLSLTLTYTWLDTCVCRGHHGSILVVVIRMWSMETQRHRF